MKEREPERETETETKGQRGETETKTDKQSDRDRLGKERPFRIIIKFSCLQEPQNELLLFPLKLGQRY